MGVYQGRQRAAGYPSKYGKAQMPPTPYTRLKKSPNSEGGAKNDKSIEESACVDFRRKHADKKGHFKTGENMPSKDSITKTARIDTGTWGKVQAVMDANGVTFSGYVKLMAEGYTPNIEGVHPAIDKGYTPIPKGVHPKNQAEKGYTPVNAGYTPLKNGVHPMDTPLSDLPDNEVINDLRQMAEISGGTLKGLLESFCARLNDGGIILTNGEIESAEPVDLTGLIAACEEKDFSVQDAIDKATQMVWRS